MKKYVVAAVILLSGSMMNGENLKRMYRESVAVAIEAAGKESARVLDDQALSLMPPVVQRYLKRTHVAGKPIPLYYRVKMKGRLRSEPGDKGMRIRCDQVNFSSDKRRYFRIKAWRAGIPAGGIHMYERARAFMKIKLLGLFPLIDLSGPDMDRSETVTLFNDMCLLAPATLADSSVEWLEATDSTAEARFTVDSCSIRATLIFNSDGDLVNFISNDRKMRRPDNSLLSAPFLTPVLAYSDFGGFRLPSVAKTVFRLPEGDFCYGDFEVTDLTYTP